MAFQRRISARRSLADRVGRPPSPSPACHLLPPFASAPLVCRCTAPSSPRMRRTGLGAAVGSGDEQGRPPSTPTSVDEGQGRPPSTPSSPLAIPAPPAFRQCGRRGSLHPLRRPSHDAAATTAAAHTSLPRQRPPPLFRSGSSPAQQLLHDSSFPARMEVGRRARADVACGIRPVPPHE